MRRDTLGGSTLRDTVAKRTDVLASIRESPARKPELTERLDVSRSTVDRAVDSLVETGLITRDDGRYHVTAHGRLSLDARREYVESTDALADAAPLLQAIPRDAEVPRPLVEDGIIRLAKPHAPENALTAPVEQLETAERLLVFSAVVKSSYMNLVHNEVVENDLDVDLVLSEQATESLASLAGAIGTVEELLDSERFSLYTTEARLPFTLFVAPDERTEVVGIMAHENGGIVGSATCGAETALEWGRNMFDDVIADADPVQKSELM